MVKRSHLLPCHPQRFGGVVVGTRVSAFVIVMRKLTTKKVHAQIQALVIDRPYIIHVKTKTRK